MNTWISIIIIVIEFYHTPKPMTLGSIFSSGTSTSSMAICPVMLALSENFPSIFGAVRPFIPFSRINPRILSLSLSHLPHTMNTSAIGEFVILKKKKNIHCTYAWAKCLKGHNSHRFFMYKIKIFEISELITGYW